jgi:hypothetical protein
MHLAGETDSQNVGTARLFECLPSILRVAYVYAIETSGFGRDFDKILNLLEVKRW